jgi:hypothetical protein
LRFAPDRPTPFSSAAPNPSSSNLAPIKPGENRRIRSEGPERLNQIERQSWAPRALAVQKALPWIKPARGDALELMDSLRFRSQKEKHELSHLYEAKIKNMGNAGGNGGEYYTPRPLIRAMFKVVKPRVSERIHDGAVGSAGFLFAAEPSGDLHVNSPYSFDIQPAMARPISSGESSWTKWIPATVTSSCAGHLRTKSTNQSLARIAPGSAFKNSLGTSLVASQSA